MRLIVLRSSVSITLAGDRVQGGFEVMRRCSIA